MKTENLLDKLIAEYKQDRKKHPIKWMWIDFKSWVLTSINWVRIKLTKKNKNKMRREIEFRAKEVDTGKWVYGSYTAMREDDHNECFRTKPHKIYHRIWQWESGDWNMGGYANYEVIPETVCQWTGLLDKHGVKIFEGDIVDWVDSDGNKRRDIVKWINGGLVLCNSRYTVGSYPNIKVVGNIHDNPELILNLE